MGRGYRLGIEQDRFDAIFGARPEGAARGRYVSNPITGKVERLQDMTPEHRRAYLSKKRGKPTNLHIIRDIEPFKTGEIDGQVIGNRQEMRDYMHQNDLAEYEPSLTAKPAMDLDEANLDESIERAMQTSALDIAPLDHASEDDAAGLEMIDGA